MTAIQLLQHRISLLKRVSDWLDEPSRAFLQSVEYELPDFSLIDLPSVQYLLGVKRKLQNLARRSPDKQQADRLQFERERMLKRI